MSDSFFAIRLILRFGTAGAAVLAALVCVGTGLLLWSMIGWPALLTAPLVGGLVFLLCKSYVELVSIVFSMVH